MSLVLTFVESCCFVDRGLKETASSLWEAYQDWCRVCGVIPIQRETFYHRAGEFFPVEDTPRRFSGVCLKPDEDWEIRDRDSTRRVYLICDESRRHVKIGVSLDPRRRLKTLQTGCSQELTLLGSIEGGYKAEALLHRKYRSKRIDQRREWFALTSEDVLDILKGGHDPCRDP